MTYYDTNLTNRLQRVFANGGNMINVGRTLQVSDRQLFEWIIEKTSFLEKEVKFTERLYCLRNNLTESPRCPMSGKILKFKNFFKGYANTNSKSAYDIALPDKIDPITENDKQFLRENFQQVLSTGLKELSNETNIQIKYRF